MKLSWVTGVNGFIGRHLTAQISASGSRVAGIGNIGILPPPSSLERMQFGTIDYDNLDHLLAVTGLPDVIYHLAGASSVAASVKEPGEDFRRTVISTGLLLEWIRRRAPGTRLVLVSSAAVYGNGHSGLISETATTSPMSPYGLHKLLIEREAALYARQYGLAVVTVRLFSAFGPGLKRQLLWDICRLLAAKPSHIQLGGTGDELRDWIFVSDAARLLIFASQRASNEAPVVNGGTGVPICVRDIAETLCWAWGGNIRVEYTGEVRLGDPQSLVADIKAVTQWGWHPIADHRNAIKESVEWCRHQLCSEP